MLNHTHLQNFTQGSWVEIFKNSYSKIIKLGNVSGEKKIENSRRWNMRFWSLMMGI